MLFRSASLSLNIYGRPLVLPHDSNPPPTRDPHERHQHERLQLPPILPRRHRYFRKGPSSDRGVVRRERRKAVRPLLPPSSPVSSSLSSHKEKEEARRRRRERAPALSTDSSPTRRLSSELMALMMGAPAGISAFPESDSDLTFWRGRIEGAEVRSRLFGSRCGALGGWSTEV